MLGIGVMIDRLSGNEDTVAAVKASIGQRIARMELQKTDPATTNPDKIVIRLKNGNAVSLWDDGQSCCERRYMVTDDDLSKYINAKIVSMELAEAPNVEDSYGDHEVLFLRIKTTKGTVVFSNHNEHNGYYGGFAINAALELTK